MKNKKKIITCICLVVLLLSSFFVATTFSKYMSQVYGAGAGYIAKWSFKVNNATQTFENIRLFSDVNPNIIEGNMVAPGTAGNFKLLVDATGTNTGVDYKVEILNETAKPTNLKFSCNGVTTNTMKELEQVLKGHFDANTQEKVEEFVINWEWKYETGNNQGQIINNDREDTQNAKLINEYSFDVCITGMQVVTD